MTNPCPPVLNRRSLLLGGAAALAAASLRAAPSRGAAAFSGLEPASMRLVAAPGRAPLVGPPHPETTVWCYGGGVPGPDIRVRQGERLRVVLENRLPEETTIHWHGVRLPNAMLRRLELGGNTTPQRNDLQHI